MVFISDNEASQHAVNLAVALARQDLDSVHVMHACTNEGGTPDAQKLMARCTQGLGPNVNSEVMVRRCPLLSFPPLPSCPHPLRHHTPSMFHACLKQGQVHWVYIFLLLSSYG